MTTLLLVAFFALIALLMIPVRPAAAPRLARVRPKPTDTIARR